MSDWCQIENGSLTVQLTSKGAEMKRLFHRAWNKELLWSGEDKLWERSSPILFPIVGKLKENTYTFQDKTYVMAQHGFARDMEFICTQADVHECEFFLQATKESFAQYPFLFELKVHYSLEGTKIIVKHTVKNMDRQTIYFSIGAHPEFDNDKIGEYEIHFEKKEDAYFLTSDGLLDLEKKHIFKAANLSLSSEVFNNGALVFKQPKSKYIELRHIPSNHTIRLIGTDTPYLGIWGKEHTPFVCIEPWHGVSDLNTHNQDLTSKEGIIVLPENAEHIFSYEIEMLYL